MAMVRADRHAENDMVTITPILISALRHHIPVLARLKGAWILAGAGVVGLATPLGFACLWLAVREHRSAER